MKFSKCNLLAFLTATFIVSSSGAAVQGSYNPRNPRDGSAGGQTQPTVDDPDASYLATVATPDQLLPPAALVKRISADLKLIRQNFPQTAQIGAGRQFALGQVIVMSSITSDQLTKIKANLGPLQQDSLGRFGSVLKFEKPYNPNALVNVLARPEYGELVASPNGIIGGSNSITYTPANRRTGRGAVYIFTQGSGDCLAGCINRDVTEYEVSANGRQVKEVASSSSGSTSSGGGFGLAVIQ